MIFCWNLNGLDGSDRNAPTAACWMHVATAKADYGRQVINRRLAKRDQLSRQFSLACRATRSALLGLLSGR